MKFFIPQVKPSQTTAVYEGIVKILKSQLRMVITDRRIFSLTYVHDKKTWRAEVGKMEQQEGRYEIIAIFEAKPYVVFTRAKDGSHGITIMVNQDEVTKIEDFD